MKLLALGLYFILSTMSYSQTLIIGSSKFNPPFETWSGSNKEQYGYDIDIISEICKRLKAQCKFKAYTFDELFDALQDKKIDLVISSIIITKIRQEQFLFSLPYLESNAQYIANANTPIKTMSDLNGKKIGVRKGTPYGRQVAATYDNNVIVEYPDLEDMFLGMQNGDVDAILMDYESAIFWIASNPGIYRLIGIKMPIGQGYGIMVNPDQAQLIEQINHILLQMEADGSYLNIYSQYFN